MGCFDNASLKNLKLPSSQDFIDQGGDVLTSFFKECKGRKDVASTDAATEAKKVEIAKKSNTAYSNEDYIASKRLGF